MKKKVLVFGGKGLVGSQLVKSIASHFIVIAPTHKDVNITNYKETRKFISDVNPNMILHSAGLSSIEKCETNPELALNLNAVSADYMISAAQNKKIPIYYISTDAVFDGIKIFSPFSEDLKPKPKSVYSKSKAKGEKVVLQNQINCVIRITLPYINKYEAKGDIVRSLIMSLKNGKFYSGIIDQYINPLSLFDIGLGVKTLLKNQANGVYHIAASNSMSNYEFLLHTAKLFSLSSDKIKKIKLSDFQKEKAAHRSNYCVLGVTRFNKDFYVLPTVEESLENFASKFAI